MIQALIFILLLVITALQLLKKWELLDWYSAKFGHVRWLPKADCYLCLSFWLSWLIGPVYFLFSLLQLEWILIPFCIGGMVNILLTNYDKS